MKNSGNILYFTGKKIERSDTLMHRKTTQAAIRIENAVKNGELARNGFLPSERELCRLFSIGRGALHAIFDILEKKKLIRR